MADVVAAAVRDRQGTDGPVEVAFAGETLPLDPEVLRRAAERARATRLPHNQARPVFHREIVTELADRFADATRRLTDGLEAGLDTAALDAAVESDLASLPAMLEVSEEDPADVRRELWSDPGVRAALEQLWPALTPQRLLEELFADPARLASAAPALTGAERASLVRAPGGWSLADVPLLDEAADLLGVDDRAVRAREAREREQRVAYAQGVLDIAAGSRSDDAAELSAADLMGAEALAERHETASRHTVAERAAADRTWAFGHIVVDEAQELSRMAWRLLMRRCPGRSMTIVGDVAQTGSQTGDPAGTTSWADALEPHVGDRWRQARLTVNYRTPAEIMAATADVLAALDPDQKPPRSVRETGVSPWRRATTPGELAETLAALVAAEAESLTEGRLAVIVPDGRAAIARVVPGAGDGASPDLEAAVVVLGVGQAKGLEFDSVLIAHPAAILAGPRAASATCTSR